MNKPYQKNVKKQQGYSLVEIGIAIAVMSLIVGGVASFGKNLYSQSDINNEKNNLIKMSGDLRHLFNGDFANLTDTAARNAKLFPPAIENRGYNHVWNAPVTISTDTINGLANSGYSITYQAVPQEYCNELVMAVQNSFMEIVINGTRVKSFNQNIDRPTAAANCSAANTVDVVFLGK